jgi:PAS domain S-box-containing protein
MAAGAGPSRGAFILVVDDDANMRRTLQLLLSEDEEVETVADGRAALAAVARRLPDLILSDLVIPGLDGFGLLHALRADPRTRLVPVIAISGLEEEEARIAALESGASDFLIKPFSERELRARVATQLEMARLRREAVQQESEERFRLLVEAIKDYAICLLDAEGRIVSWNAGAETIHGYRAEEILGRSFAVFHLEDPDWRATGVLHRAATEGRYEAEGWRVRRDGSRFWANTVFTSIHDEGGRLWGFAKITRDLTERKHAEEEIARLNADLERRVHARTAELEAANAELEAFSYSVSHDLRAPLRAIDGFSQALMEDFREQLPRPAGDYLRRIVAATRRMSDLIDGLLDLSRVSRAEMRWQDVDLATMARQEAEALQRAEPQRRVEWVIPESLAARGDPRLLRVALDNLIGNAWKFTAGKEAARIQIGQRTNGEGREYFVADDGAGFDMAYAGKLFGAFQRLHTEREFEGTGIGLATVRRVISRHGGRIWAEAAPGRGATFFFTLGAEIPAEASVRPASPPGTGPG